MTSLTQMCIGRFSTVIIALAMLVTFTPEVQGQTAVALRYKWKEGEVIRQRQTTETASTGTSPMGPMKSSKKEVFVVRMQVQSVADDGSATLECLYESLRIDSDSEMGKVTFDSSDPEAAKPSDPAVKAQASIVGEQWIMVMRPDGSIKSVKGFEKLLDQMRRYMNDLPPASRAPFDRMFSEEWLQEMMYQHAMTFPSHEVRVGESWTQNSRTRLPMIGTMTKAMTMTYKGMQDLAGSQVAKVDLSMNVGHEPAAKDEQDPVLSDMKVSMKDGTGSGEIWFDVAKGQLRKQLVRHAMTIDLAGPHGMNISQRIEAVTTIEVIDDDATDSAAGKK
ncbi:MAG: hypothetical protein KF699_09170 [Phycisphaeraceae bacterium]|nr:hypothetical protein [Phycisphaeraceae bacterium]